MILDNLEYDDDEKQKKLEVKALHVFTALLLNTGASGAQEETCSMAFEDIQIVSEFCEYYDTFGLSLSNKPKHVRPPIDTGFEAPNIE